MDTSTRHETVSAISHHTRTGTYQGSGRTSNCVQETSSSEEQDTTAVIRPLRCPRVHVELEFNKRPCGKQSESPTYAGEFSHRPGNSRRTRCSRHSRTSSHSHSRNRGRSRDQ